MASVTLASKYTSPLEVGPYTITPGSTYTDSQIDFSNDQIADAITRGDLVFNDGTNTTAAYTSSPVVQEDVAQDVHDNAPADASLTAADQTASTQDGGVIPPTDQTPQ